MRSGYCLFRGFETTSNLAFILPLSFCMLFCVVADAQQQPPTPQLLAVFPPGAKAGSTIDVRILDQAELEFADGLIFSHPGIVAQPKMQSDKRFFPTPRPRRNEFEVTIAADVPPGVYEVRGKCAYGISNPRRFVVSSASEFNETEPNDRFENAGEIQLASGGTDTVVNGVFEAGYDIYKCRVQAGDALVFRCDSQAIDSQGDPVIALFDDQQNLIARNHDTNGRDALVSWSAGYDGDLYIRVNDLTFVSQGGAGTTPYRLTISRKPFVDYVVPPVIPGNTVSTVKVYGRNLGGGHSGQYRNGIELEVIEKKIDPSSLANSSDAGFSELTLPPNCYQANARLLQVSNRFGKSNPVPVTISSLPLVDEKTAGGKIQPGANILGTFGAPGEVDSYRFQAKQGEPFWIEVVSQRLGIGTDPYVSIESVHINQDQQETYRRVITADDYKPLTTSFRIALDSEDPAVLFTAPNDGEFRISVYDLFNLPPGTRGPNFYQLTCRKPEADVQLVAIPGLECGQNDNHSRPLKILPCIVRPNGGGEIQVFAHRSPGFDQPIALFVEGLPAGVTAQPSVISESANHGTIVLQGAPDLKAGYATVKVWGTYQTDGKPVRVPVVAAIITTNSIGNEPAESRLADRIVVITDPTVVFPGEIKTTQQEFHTAVGGQIELKAKFVKSPMHSGQVLQGFLHGLPRTVGKNANTLPDNGSEVTFRMDFRQGTPAGIYTPFIRAYFENNTRRFEKKLEEVTAEQKRISTQVSQLESEYRKTTQQRQRLSTQLNQARQNLSRLTQQRKNAESNLASARKNLEEALAKDAKLTDRLVQLNAQIKNRMENAGLEKDANRKKKLENELAELIRQKTQLVSQSTLSKQALQTVEKAVSQAESVVKQAAIELDKQKALTEKVEAELEQITQKEKRLNQDRSDGQQVKRDIDAELNLARQAANPRRRRYLVYSAPVRIKVDPYPIELKLATSKFSITQGESATVDLSITRKFGFQGNINIQLRPGKGGNGWGFKSNPQLKGNASSETKKLEIVIQKNAKPGTYPGQIVATFRHGNANLTYTLPIEIEVKALPKPVKK